MSEFVRIGSLSAVAARVHASVCQVEAIVECGAVDMRAVVELVNNRGSFFSFLYIVVAVCEL